MMVTAFVLINVENRRTSEVAQRIAEVEHVAEVYSVTGDYDQIALTDGVTETQTILAFRAFTRRELDSAYDIGLS
jgi:DNA-binding Lrp family transcriptional regulator